MTTVLNTTKDQPKYPRKLSELKFEFYAADDIFPDRTVACVNYNLALLRVGLMEGDSLSRHPKMNVFKWRYFNDTPSEGNVFQWTEEEIDRELEEMDYLFGSKVEPACDFASMKVTLNNMSLELASLKVKLAEQQEMINDVKRKLEMVGNESKSILE